MADDDHSICTELPAFARFKPGADISVGGGFPACDSGRAVPHLALEPLVVAYQVIEASSISSSAPRRVRRASSFSLASVFGVRCSSITAPV